MSVVAAFFWLGIFIIFYAYLGYGMLIFLLLKIRKLLSLKHPVPNENYLPGVSLIIPAYNSESYIQEKIENTLKLDYPSDLLEIIFVTDGSSDNTPQIVERYPAFKLLHQHLRQGKVMAMHRAIQETKHEILIFCDDNTFLNSSAIKEIVKHYSIENVGGVAGEKKIFKSSDISGQGEGVYWKYESFLKQLDSDFFTVVGAAGELFSIRKSLYEAVPSDVLLDDFYISLKICQKGYRVIYEPNAYAEEYPSTDLKEEEKRKVRISAGGFQSIFLLKEILNVFKYPILSFQYISHRVLRWLIAPFLLPIIFICNVFLAMNEGNLLYQWVFLGQIFFYTLALVGLIQSKFNKKSALTYIAYYFVFMNISLYKGLVSYMKKRQTVLWDKAARTQRT